MRELQMPSWPTVPAGDSGDSYFPFLSSSNYAPLLTPSAWAGEGRGTGPSSWLTCNRLMKPRAHWSAKISHPAQRC